MAGCGSKAYQGISREKIDFALETLGKSGATVTGNNPWVVDTHNFGVQLLANWQEGSQILNLTVTDYDGTIPCAIIWSYLNSIVAKYK